MDLEKIAKWVKEQWTSPYKEKRALEGCDQRIYGSAPDSEPRLNPCPVCGSTVQESISLNNLGANAEKTHLFIRCLLPCGYQSVPFLDRMSAIEAYNAGTLASQDGSQIKIHKGETRD